MRIKRRVAQLVGDPALEFLREVVLQHLSLVVHPVPWHLQRLGEERLDQSVVTDDLERHALAGAGQAHAVVGGVTNEAELIEPLQHRRDRRRSDPETLGE